MQLYCNSLTAYSRLVTREISIGHLLLGGNHPIRLQSMTTTDTMDTRATVEQSIRMIEAGSELVRITAPSINEANNLAAIKKELRQRGYQTPLVADIHFTPNAAEAAARIVEKVRINPGNFADKKKFENIAYSDDSYDAELERIRNRFLPLVRICKEYGTAMRIGTNHGSLSDRIMSRYGDTALGMVESALEFLRICESENYYSIVLSMKSSNPQVMVQAYRLLIQKMHAEEMNYPLHLGVTEAGEGEDGRIKSAAGIGTLLEDGIGDTVRVSLTEDPEFEIPVARELVQRYNTRSRHAAFDGRLAEKIKDNLPYSPFDYKKRETIAINNIGHHHVPIVVADLSNVKELTPASLFGVGYNYSVPLDKWNIADQACDYIYTGNQIPSFEIPGTLGIICNYKCWLQHQGSDRVYPFLSAAEYLDLNKQPGSLVFVLVSEKELLNDDLLHRMDKKTVLVIQTDNEHAMPHLRAQFIYLMQKNCTVPVLVKRTYTNGTEEQVQLYASTDVGGLLLDGMGDGVFLSAPAIVSPASLNRVSFGVLQACRQRTSKTEYISCPSCGRTLFDLQETTARIRQRTDHLKGLKIGIMGCIVNGPGEMADADYGYVGSGPGKITLYKGKEVVQRNIDTGKAVDALIDLIKQHGDWVEKEVMENA